MSASENLKRLEEEERRKEVLAEQARNRRADEASKKAAEEASRRQDLYNSGLFAAATLQNELFEQLRQAKVVEMITDITKRRFFKPRAPLINEEPLVRKELPNREILAEAFSHLEWSVSVLDPEMSRVGKWEEFLKIDITKNHRDYYGGRMQTTQIDRILFSYSPNHRLFIDGEKRTFDDQLVIPPSDAQTEKLEQAVALAFHKPKIERVNDRSTVMLPPMRFTG